MQTNLTPKTPNNSLASSENVTLGSSASSSGLKLTLSQFLETTSNTSSISDRSFTNLENPLTTLDELNDHLIAHPGDNDARLARAELLMKMEQYSQALEDYLVLYQTNKTPHILDALVNGYVSKGMLNMGNGLFTAASEDFTQALEYAPTSVRAFFFRGLAYKCANDNDRADVDYQKVLEYDTGYTPAWKGRGFIAHAEGRLEDAIAFFEHAHAQDPNDGETVEQMIEVYEAKGVRDGIDYAEVISTHKFSLQISKSDVNTAMKEGHGYFNYRNYAKARQCYEKAHQLDPSNIDAMGCLGETLLKLERYGAAISLLEKAEEIDPKNKDLHEVLPGAYRAGAAAYEKQRDFRRAAACYSGVLRFDPEDERARENRGKARFHAGDFYYALEDLMHVQAKDKENARLLPYIGACTYKVGKIAQGIGILNHAKKLKKGDPAFIDRHLNEAHRTLHRHLRTFAI